MTLHGKRLIRSFGDYYGLKPDDSADIDDTTVLDSPYIERLYSYTGGSYVAVAEPQQLSGYAITSSGEIVPIMPLTLPATVPPTTDSDQDSNTLGGSAMLREGKFILEGSTFTVDGRDYLLRIRDSPAKGQPPYYLLAMPGGFYVSGLWPKGEGVFSLDYTRSDGSERVFRLDFREAGYVTVTDYGFSRRSLSRAPWQQTPRRKGKRDG